jgi:hypothetical protein
LNFSIFVQRLSLALLQSLPNQQPDDHWFRYVNIPMILLWFLGFGELLDSAWSS